MDKLSKEHLEKLIASHQWRLEMLKKKMIDQGHSVDVATLHEIGILEERIPKLQAQLDALKDDRGQAETIDGNEKRLRQLSERLTRHQNNLHKLKLQEANYGAGDVPLRISNQIEMTEQEIEELQRELKNLTEGDTSI